MAMLYMLYVLRHDDKKSTEIVPWQETSTWYFTYTALAEDLLVTMATNTHIHTIFGRYYSDVIMGTVTSQITSLTIVYLTVYSGADQRKH